MKNQKKNAGGFVSKKPSQNMHKGILMAPPLTLYSSYQQPPPLLPLPIHNSLPSRGRQLSCPPANRKYSNRARDQSLTQKKSNISKQPIKRELDESKLEIFKRPAEKTAQAISEQSFIVTSVNPLGPDPSELPKDMSKVLSAGIINVAVQQDFQKLSGPDPSSLPLPKFSLRPKLMTRCNAEAAGVDAGATDNLRRLLRLR